VGRRLKLLDQFFRLQTVTRLFILFHGHDGRGSLLLRKQGPRKLAHSKVLLISAAPSRSG